MIIVFLPLAPSSSGLGRQILILVTAVQIRLGPSAISSAFKRLKFFL
jgi:hypothetical protein